MTASEVTEFEKHRNIFDIVRVRHLDDAGKVAGMPTPAFTHYAPIVQRIVDGHCGTNSVG